MNIDSRSIISITEANQNFSKIAKLVDDTGEAVIFKRNKPKYIMLDVNNREVIEKAYKQLKEMYEEGGQP